MVEIATVLNYLLGQLGNFRYYPPECKSPEACLLAVYHSHTWDTNKKRVVDSFKGSGTIRVVISTNALCMGVNFPDVCYIINWGPARTILDLHQQAGRAGRDGLTSHIIILYHGQQAGPCEQAVKYFVHSKGCLRVAAYQSLDSNIQPIEPLHECCSHCRIECMCKGGACDVDFLPFEEDYTPVDHTGNADHPHRTVSSQDRMDLRNALMEVLHNVQSQSISIDDTSRHGFSIQLVEDITARCDMIFGINDITTNFPVYSLANAEKILEVIQEIFLDIPDFYETTINLVGNENSLDTDNHFNWWKFEENLTFNDSESD
jgi:hypothetical protein